VLQSKIDKNTTKNTKLFAKQPEENIKQRDYDNFYAISMHIPFHWAIFKKGLQEPLLLHAYRAQDANSNLSQNFENSFFRPQVSPCMGPSTTYLLAC